MNYFQKDPLDRAIQNFQYNNNIGLEISHDISGASDYNYLMKP